VSLAGNRGLRKLASGLTGNLYLSETAHLVLPYHRELMPAREAERKEQDRPTKRASAPPTATSGTDGAARDRFDHPPASRASLEAKIKENNEILRLRRQAAVSRGPCG